MKETLKVGITHEMRYTVPENKTVPHLYPEATEFQGMPKVFATGYLVGLVEWTCIEAIKPHIDWPREQSVGIAIDINHTAATPPGFEVRVSIKLTEVDKKRLVFEVEAHDGVDRISRGTHERFIIDAAKFNQSVATKAIENE